MIESMTWLITGANRGLGRALTSAVLEAGHDVVATMRGESSLPVHDRMRVLTLDVRDRDAARRCVEEAAALTGRLDVVVNNAGYGLIGAIEEVSETDLREIVETNSFGPVWLSQAAIPHMRDQGSGHIVQISTVGAVGTMPMLGAYNASKWALEAFSEAMAAEVRDFGIRVSLIEPGALDTEWAGGSMRFSTPSAAYDRLREDLFGTAEVPWPVGESAGGTSPRDAAVEIISHVLGRGDGRLRVLIGDDAPDAVRTALDRRRDDYSLDPRFREDGV